MMKKLNLPEEAARIRRKASAAMRMRRRNIVWDLRCHGKSQQGIVKKLVAEHSIVVTQPTVSRDLAWMARLALGDLTERVRTVKLEQVAQLEYIVEEALQSWEISKGPEKQVAQRKRQVGGGEGDQAGMVPTEVVTRVREKTGDSRFLQTAMVAMGGIRKIMGADAPMLMDVVSGGESLVRKVDFSALSDDELRVILARRRREKDDSDNSVKA